MSPHILEVAVPNNKLPGPYIPSNLGGPLDVDDFVWWFAAFARAPFTVFDADIS